MNTIFSLLKNIDLKTIIFIIRFITIYVALFYSTSIIMHSESSSRSGIPWNLPYYYPMMNVIFYGIFIGFSFGIQINYFFFNQIKKTVNPMSLNFIIFYSIFFLMTGAYCFFNASSDANTFNRQLFQDSTIHSFSPSLYLNHTKAKSLCFYYYNDNKNISSSSLLKNYTIIYPIPYLNNSNLKMNDDDIINNNFFVSKINTYWDNSSTSDIYKSIKYLCDDDFYYKEKKSYLFDNKKDDYDNKYIKIPDLPIFRIFSYINYSFLLLEISFLIFVIDGFFFMHNILYISAENTNRINRFNNNINNENIEMINLYNNNNNNNFNDDISSLTTTETSIPVSVEAAETTSTLNNINTNYIDLRNIFNNIQYTTDVNNFKKFLVVVAINVISILIFFYIIFVYLILKDNYESGHVFIGGEYINVISLYSIFSFFIFWSSFLGFFCMFDDYDKVQINNMRLRERILMLNNDIITIPTQTQQPLIFNVELNINNNIDNDQCKIYPFNNLSLLNINNNNNNNNGNNIVLNNDNSSIILNNDNSNIVTNNDNSSFTNNDNSNIVLHNDNSSVTNNDNNNNIVLHNDNSSVTNNGVNLLSSQNPLLLINNHSSRSSSISTSTTTQHINNQTSFFNRETNQNNNIQRFFSHYRQTSYLRNRIEIKFINKFIIFMIYLFIQIYLICFISTMMYGYNINNSVYYLKYIESNKTYTYDIETKKRQYDPSLIKNDICDFYQQDFRGFNVSPLNMYMLSEPNNYKYGFISPFSPNYPCKSSRNDVTKYYKNYLYDSYNKKTYMTFVWRLIEYIPGVGMSDIVENSNVYDIINVSEVLNIEYNILFPSNNNYNPYEIDLIFDNDDIYDNYGRSYPKLLISSRFTIILLFLYSLFILILLYHFLLKNLSLYNDKSSSNLIVEKILVFILFILGSFVASLFLIHKGFFNIGDLHKFYM